jgi:hypothetical protein
MVIMDSQEAAKLQVDAQADFVSVLNSESDSVSSRPVVGGWAGGWVVHIHKHALTHVPIHTHAQTHT